MSMTMDNQEDILDALRDFEKKTPLEIPPVLEQYLGRVASTGETIFPWSSMKPLFVKKLDEVMQQFETETHMDNLPLSPNVENVKFDAMRRRILEAIDRFHGAPFTIQRLCELITEPKKHYKRADKFLRGVEKNILVVSTVDPFGRKIVSESKSLVNGLDSNGHTQQAEKSSQGDRTLTCPKASIAAAHEANWLSNETTSPVATAVPMKGQVHSNIDADSELGGGEGASIEKNSDPSAEKNNGHRSSAAPGDSSGLRETTEPTESSRSPPCPSNNAQDVKIWPNADSTQPSIKESGDALVLPDSQEALEKPPLVHSHDEEKMKHSAPHIHSEETMDHPFPEVRGSTQTADQPTAQTSWPSSENHETSDNQTVVSSTEQDSKPMDEIEKEEEPSSSREGEQVVTHSFSSGTVGVAASSGSDAQTSAEAPEEGISSSESSGTPSPPGVPQEHPQKEAVSASAPRALPDSQALTSEPQETNNANVPDTVSADTNPALSLHEKETELEIGSCDTTDPASSSSDNASIAMETEDSMAVTTGSALNNDSNPPESSSSSLENPSPPDEPMDQD